MQIHGRWGVIFATTPANVSLTRFLTYVFYFSFFFFPGGMASFPIMPNSLVHIVMYTYYLFSINKNPTIQAVINTIKPYITIMQMVSQTTRTSLTRSRDQCIKDLFQPPGPVLHNHRSRSTGLAPLMQRAHRSGLCVHSQCVPHLLPLLRLLHNELQERRQGYQEG